MAIEQGLLQLVASDSGVQALVPNDAAGNPQLYFILAPKGSVVPYIVLSRVATTDVYTTAGATGLRAALFQIDCYATSYYASRAISLAVREVLQSFSGNLPDTDKTVVAAVFIEKDWDFPYEEGAKGFVYRALLQFRIWTNDDSYVDTTVVRGGNF